MFRTLVNALMVAALLGCASSVALLRIGQTEDDVLTTLGQPTGRYALPEGGQRLEYATGPFGVHTWMIDVDAQRRVTATQQVLQQRYFDQVRDGMSRDALLRLLGRPADVSREWQQRETWSWRFDTYDCLWFRVTLSAQQQVLGGGAMLPDPRCEPRAAH
jgi:hypothetical protein